MLVVNCLYMRYISKINNEHSLGNFTHIRLCNGLNIKQSSFCKDEIRSAPVKSRPHQIESALGTGKGVHSVTSAG